MSRNFLWISLFLVFLLRITLYLFFRPDYFEGTKIRLTARVTSEPIRYSSSQYFRLGNFKIYPPLYPEISYGDEITIEGSYSQGKLKETKLIELNVNNGLLYRLRKRILGVYEKSLPNRDAALIAGVALGSKKNIGTEFWESLKKSGTAHVVVASGMNITLVAGFLMSFLVTFLPRRRAIGFALVGVWVYSFFAGFDAPIVRAAFMGTLAFAAQELGRLNLALKSLFMSFFVILIVKPEWISDIGFWLSFVATLSILILNNRIEAKLKFIKIDFLRKDLATTTSAQIGVAPIIFATFGQFNILSPLINAAVLWTIPLITILGLFGGLLGLIYVPLGRIILWLSFPLTSYFIKMVSLLGN